MTKFDEAIEIVTNNESGACNDIRWGETSELNRLIERRERIEAAIAKATGK